MGIQVRSWDDKVKGLHERQGRWYVFYRTKTGQQRCSNIGRAGILPVGEARKIAKSILNEVSAGKDPFGEKKVQRKNPTVAQVYRELLATVYIQPRYLESGHANEVAMNWKNHLQKTFGAIKITALSAPAIRKWHRTLWATPYAANRSKALLSRICSFAEELGYREPGQNPCKSVPNYTELERERHATEDEIKAIGAILERDKAVYFREVTFIYLLIFTGSRPRALERLTWKDDWQYVDGGAVVKTKGKRGKDELFVSQPLLDMLFEIHLPGDRVIGAYPRTYWERVRKEAGCEDLWARDWRRTFGAIGLSCGLTRGAVGELLNQKSVQTTKRYSPLIPRAKIAKAKQISSELERMLK